MALQPPTLEKVIDSPFALTPEQTQILTTAFIQLKEQDPKLKPFNILPEKTAQEVQELIGVLNSLAEKYKVAFEGTDTISILLSILHEVLYEIHKREIKDGYDILLCGLIVEWVSEFRVFEKTLETASR